MAVYNPEREVQQFSYRVKFTGFLKSLGMENAKYFSRKRLQLLEVRIKKFEKQVSPGKKEDPQNILIDNADFIRLLKISPKTSRNWRRQGLIPYAKVGHKIYFKLSDVDKLIEENTQELKGKTSHNQPIL